MHDDDIKPGTQAAWISRDGTEVIPAEVVEVSREPWFAVTSREERNGSTRRFTRINEDGGTLECGHFSLMVGSHRPDPDDVRRHVEKRRAELLDDTGGES